MNTENYNPEVYWDQVAMEIADRKKLKIIAGDDEPYYRYKRKKFLQLLDKMNVEGRTILEVGSGPGGNLEYLYNKNPAKISGTDISEKMVSLSKSLLTKYKIEIRKTDGNTIPFETDSYEIVFTATVLQHNVNEEKLKKIILEICRISNSDIYIYERIENTIKGHESNLGRPIKYYADLFGEHGFKLLRVEFINVEVSYLVSGAIRKIFNKSGRSEGEKISKLSELLQNITLPLTKILDKYFKKNRDVTMLHFTKK
jgi:SAM-dependent methyltransferase